MSENGHAPWKITHFADGTVGIHAPDGAGWLEVAVLRGRFGQDRALLLAAAPDMLEALRTLCAPDVSYIDGEIRIPLASHGDALNAMRLAREAIAKAEGPS